MDNLVICNNCLDSGWEISFQNGNILYKLLPYQDAQVSPKMCVYEACLACKKGQNNIPKDV